MAKRANGEGSIITQIRNGKNYYTGYVTLYNINGKSIRKTKSSYKKGDVVKWMNEVKSQNFTENTLNTLGNYAKSWAELYKYPYLAPKSIATLKRVIAILCEHPISDMVISEITVDHMQNFFNDITKNVGLATIEHVHLRIKSIFKHLRNEGAINIDPMLNVKVKKYVRNKRPVYSLEEQKNLIKNLDLNDLVHAAIYVDFATGLRLGELLALTDESIVGNELHIRKQYIDREIRDLKTKSSIRNVPIPKKIMPILKKLAKKKGYLFSYDGSEPLPRNTVYNEFNRLKKKLNTPNHTFHSIRHAYSTRLYEKNVPIKVIQTLMGHSNFATTLDIYTHVSNDMRVESVDKLDDLL